MRTIHALRIEGLATEELAQIFHRLLNVVKNAPRNPMEPDEYQNFNFLKNSCVTIIRDGLRQFGLKKIRGLFPRDLFVSCVYELFRIKHESGLKISYYKKTQLKIPEAPYSQPTPILNPLNYYRWWAVQKSWGLQND